MAGCDMHFDDSRDLDGGYEISVLEMSWNWCDFSKPRRLYRTDRRNLGI